MRLTICAAFLFALTAGFALPALAAAIPMTSGLSIGLTVAPNGLEAVAVSSTGIDLYWTADRITADSVAVYRDGSLIATAPASQQLYHDTGLNPDTLYTYSLSPVVSGTPEADKVAESVTEKTYPSWRASDRFDVIVVGGSGSGVAAARSAAVFGARVALIEDTNRLGGMSSNGLGRPDIRDASKASGFFQDMRMRIKRYYGKGSGLAFEPGVANAVVKSMLYEYPKIEIFRKARVVGVLKHGRNVVGVRLTPVSSGPIADFSAPVVIDATVEGDVAAASGARYWVGREHASLQEPHNGVIYYDDKTAKILPGSTGKADKRVQSYSYLLTVKDYGPGADKTIPKPPYYDKNNYLYSPEWKQTWNVTSGKLPDNKYEINQHPWGTDLPGINYCYPEASADVRAQVEQRYREHSLGYLYYLQTEQGLKNLGLADDEYRDTGNFPPTLYVREGRRVEGLRVLNESDVSRARDYVEPTSIAIGDYPMDSHAVTNPPSPDVQYKGEGEWWLVHQTPWYHTPVDVIVPMDVDGLLVSTAVSATHVGYGTLRMEPIRMSMGDAAGVTAALAAQFHIPPAYVPPSFVQEKLLSISSYITWYKDVNPKTPHFRAIQFMGVRGMCRAEDFRPNDTLTQAEAGQWISCLSILEGRRPATVSAGTNAPVTRAEFARMLLRSGERTAPVGAFLKSGDPNAVLTRADAAFGVYLAHRDYALGSRAFTERAEYVRARRAMSGER